ncbi:reverse transcriptase [Riemerella anatipestifer]|nr:reverse transcriptase [Riemerella anatipestifer]MBT0557055.1 reverse transcriptase [Riemerella anatipestifer]MBT0561163.1 reverse transcriptase [Riemerella anatipestifer]NAV17411.1 reverse transcriptase [Riemerella anatipestifer]
MSSLLYQQLYQAYFAARRNKRTKPEQLRFEVNYETEINRLYQDIISRNYTPLPSKVFVTRKPVDREIFAPRFRDRVVHHLIYRYIYKHLDAKFIYDSYSCRVGKGTLFGIERAKGFLRKASANYTKDAYVLKLDINGYFMNINRECLWQSVEHHLDYTALNITQTEQDTLRYLIRQVVLHDAAVGAERCSPRHYWEHIPAGKSLFCTAETCGLPIGSLTSQLFSNVYLNDIDHKIKARFHYYGRYVDDLLLIDRDKEKLLDLIPQINTWLAEVQLNLHPKKIYFQHYTKGFYFLGQYIKPYRTYISKRIKKHIY